MDVTKKLTELNPDMALHNEGDWENPHDPEKPASFSSFNDAGIETETGEFLYAMARMLKPESVLETGTHWGVGASYMAMALKQNRKGKITTIEFHRHIWEIADRTFKALGLNHQVENLLMDVRDYNPGDKKFQLILLDTEPQTRFDEMVRFLDNLEDGGFLFIHDLHRNMHQVPNADHGFAWPFGTIPEVIRESVNKGTLRPIHFPTPRGFAGFYKVRQDDHNWHKPDKEFRYKLGG